MGSTMPSTELDRLKLMLSFWRYMDQAEVLVSTELLQWSAIEYEMNASIVSNVSSDISVFMIDSVDASRPF